MDEYLIKSRVGKTPLVRAERLEKELGVSNIYLKLEGNNPSGHREDRLAYLLIRDALAVGKTTLCLGVFGVLAKSLAYLSQYYDVKCVFVLPERSKTKESKLLKFPNIEVIRHGKNHHESIQKSEELSKENNWYNVNPGLENNVLNMTALSYISDEIDSQVKGELTSIFTQMSYGYLLSGIHLGFRQLWVKEQIEKLPMLYSCTTNEGNQIYESYKKNSSKILPLSKEGFKITKYNKHLIGFQSSTAQEALDAVYDTGGKITGITDEELLHYTEKFRKLENIKLDVANGYAVAGFMKEAEAGNVQEGNHVILLNDGRANLEVREISRKENLLSDEKIVSLVDDWLMEFSDPADEIHNALDNAYEKGFVIVAYHNKQIAGIAIIVNFGFDKFATKYHLAYIATRKNTKGRGIATEILQKAIQLTEGNLSLHVENYNKRAIKLYEKMGFENCYSRMIYTASEE